ncbi:MAG: RNA polymerase-associated protein RapA [Gammaproteobacteria bacterium]|nr:RNA polymerase-associated protein RapA [Gammaproteobacteria bacterium]NNJ49757.1 RNA polymerase-associated protein RapA [Gammaproteobacteria bacterium]
MAEFLPGQRCISDAELQMGLGTILSVEQRTLTVLFLATDETRTYAKLTAPLTRVMFSIGDSVNTHDGVKITVKEVFESHGLLTYSGIDARGITHQIEEAELDNFIQLNRPSERLFNGQIDKDNWFELRFQTLYHRNRLAKSDLYGLTGSRTSLIPHQLYIAHEVANRYAPRVLLADEVGLGKTIEAGLILHHQILTERAKRVLIVVPETLMHQWLVEMLRRFNLHFKIFDEDRCQDLIVANEYENIFYSEQLVLCSIDFLVANASIFEQCVRADWDLMVVDEAHHLQWSADEPSIEYMLVEQLSQQTKGVLLLTATPEQLGKESHFARLRLLDADRFPDFQQFVEEEANYEPYAQVIEDLLNNETLSAEDVALIGETIEEGDNLTLLELVKEGTEREDDVQQARYKLVEHLLDRHGTGRVLFRNTRSAVKGFPERQLSAYPLALPEEYRSLKHADVSELLTPELLYQRVNATLHWTQVDPRISWLSNKCAELNPDKILVITADATTALDITQYFKTQTGLHATAFHEGLSIVERDRAAAFFADFETGSQILVCSEIGSEGRNFQFAHHLVLFDLPINPDLLEQRIGRLDRIGQSETINIHVPYFEASAQSVCFSWYHEALQAFSHTCPAGHSVYKRVQHELYNALSEINEYGSASETVASLLDKSRIYYAELTESLQRGRDRLLEYNSCRPAIAQDIKCRADVEDNSSELAEYMESVYDCFGIDNELHSEGCFVITPTEHMINNFPGLAEDGMTITYDRNVALSFEDAHFISWEHPLTNNAIDMVVTNEMGNTSVTAVEYKGVTAGSVLLECLFSLESAPIDELQSSRYLPPTMIRVVCDERGADHHLKLPHKTINEGRQFVDKGVGNKIVKAKKKILKAMLQRSEKFAELKSAKLLELAQENASNILTIEINRLKALSNVNPNIRKDEILYFEKQLSMLTEVIDAANIRLDAVRVIVAT